MTIGGYILCAVLSFLLFAFIWCFCQLLGVEHKIITLTVGIILACVVWIIGFWYYNNTASGARAVTDERAELNNGLDRVINVYTANGELIATYSGKIDLEDNEGGYVLFEFEGKRYTYYNCFVESIANIK